MSTPTPGAFGRGADKMDSTPGSQQRQKHDLSPITTPDRPRKRLKLEIKVPATAELAANRVILRAYKVRTVAKLKSSYRENLLEMMFLQDMGNIVDFPQWKRQLPSHAVQALRANRLDSDDEEEESLKRTLSTDVKSFTSSGRSTPVDSSIMTGLTIQTDNSSADVKPGYLTPKLEPGLKTPTSTSSLFATPTASPALSSKAPIKVKQETPTATSSTKTPVSSAGTPSAVPTSITGTQEAIVERAKQEAQVMQRVSELRKQGMWSVRRLPKVQEPARSKAHWDYLLEEMQWLATDFAQERKWKKVGAKKIATMISKYHKDLQQKEMKAEKEESLKTKRIANAMARMVREFWANIEKVVEYKQNSRLEEKRKKALDLHLSFIVDQTEKYSTWLTQGLTTTTKSNSSVASSPSRGDADKDFLPSSSGSDDEETIAVEEDAQDEDHTAKELEELKKEMELPIEEILRSLPQEVLDKAADIQARDTESSTGSSDEEGEEKRGTKRKADDSDEFDAEAETSSDDEETLEQEEQQAQGERAALAESGQAHKEEIAELEAEGELSLEELVKKYAGAYDSDFEEDMKAREEEETDSDDTSASGSDSDSSQAGEESEEAEEEENPEDNWLKQLSGGEPKPGGSGADTQQQQEREGPSQELNDIAATARALQPTGYTLETTKVRTAVPFMLKYTLREYQVVGLDWLATLYENRLNGILADEMGLGKTIQTISLLAHLACEKGVWGPHLIIVPTSVMLNWEMEIKKWCPAFKILTYFGTQKERKAKRTGWTKTNAFHVCITSYKLVIQDHQAFRRKKWKYLVLDEAQNIKNFKSQRWQTLLNFSSQRRLLLTGTPLQNNLMELWSLMHFLMPHVFQSHSEFKEWFANPLTGMIEGSREYNDSLIRRLHKVLRPFLLRRLKCDVEKQMPKKYEHVVRCHLSRRQRFLYDDFMSQTKTKETLATGHYMSVINILMQLRKVCNHPNLFDPRPIVSPFQMDGISFTTASLVLRALNKEPLEYLRIDELFPNLCDLELNLPAFAACRARQLQTPAKLIEEIDSTPDTSAAVPVVEKPTRRSGGRGVAQSSGRTSPFVPISQDGVSVPVTTPSVETTQLHQLPGHTPSRTPTPASASIVLSSASATTTTSQPITVQIRNTPQGTRLMIPSGQLSQLPGYIQIVQTSSGQQIIATSQPPPTAASAVNCASTYTTAGSCDSHPVHLPQGGGAAVTGKPVMRVMPLATAATTTTSVLTSNAGASNGGGRATASSEVKSVIGTRLSSRAAFSKTSLFTMESLESKRLQRRRAKLESLARVSRKHSEAKPVYGSDFREAVEAMAGTRERERSRWKSLGFIHCNRVHSGRESHPSVFWRQTKALQQLIRNPLQYLEQLKDILDRFTIAVPAVTAPRITMRTFHPPPSYLTEERHLVSTLQREISPKAACLHGIQSRMAVQVPEARLIQYDCGKLQTLDILLRRLKCDQHRVLIFTQMTKMLDVLESFLNYHGHRYVRLDGTTKVEQRQLLMERFNADKRIFVFILSTRSGGLGVNLTGADTVIFYDSDWNPTMDAQAQDRCHRIGQTRDVHIYRLISEKTIEENILKKANQKRLLGDVAIEGGNFTTAFFKQNTIQELFEEPSGLDALAKEKQESENARAHTDSSVYKHEPEETAAPATVKTAVKQNVKEEKDTEAGAAATEEASIGRRRSSRPPSQASSGAAGGAGMSEEQMEVVLGAAEDEQDLQAARVAKAEQKAELAEFDEDIPWDEREAEQKQSREQETSRLELDLQMLEKELTPIERYAVVYMEGELAPACIDELEKAEDEVQIAKEEWELSHLKALKEDEERRAELEDDEMLFTYSREDSLAQVYVWDETGEHMPMWTPPTPPQDASDVYVDFTACFLYEPSVMPESQLPPLYVKKENKRQRIDPAVATRKHKGVKREEESRVPRSLFDRPTSLLRRDAKMAKLKQSMGLKTQLGKTHQQAMLQRPLLDAGADYPEWLIHEDWALLQAVQTLLELPLNLTTTSPAHIHNWDLIADVVNAASRTYRSSKQCKTRFESTIVPREEGRILYDMNPRKQKKTKGMYKMYNTKNNRPMKTNQIFAQDNNSSVTQLFSHRFDACKAISAKRTPTPRPTLANPTLKNLKHAVVLAENGINYDTPLNPVQVAQIKADRIAKEKKEQLIQQKSQQQQLTQQQLVVQTVSVTSVTPTVTAVTATPALTVVHAGLQAVATAAGATVVPAANLKSMAAMSLGQVAAVQPAAASKTATLQPAAGSIVVNTHQVAGNLSQIRKLATGQTVVGSLAPNVLTASSAQVANLARSLPARSTSIGVQEIQAAVNQNQARIAGNTVVSTLTTTQLLGQKATVQGATAAQLTSQNKAQLLIQQQQQKQQALLRQQQQRRALLGQVTALQQQKTVAVTTPLLSTQFSPAAVAAANTSAAARLHSPAQAQKRLSTTDMAVLLRQQQTKQLAGVAGVQASTAQVRQVQVSQGALQASMLTTAQILSGSQLVSSGPTSQPIATLVKTVATTHAASVATLPVSAVSINLPQKALGKGSAQLGQAAQLQVRSLQQPRKTVAARVALSNPTKTGTPVIMSQRGGQSISLQAFTSLVKQAGGTAGIPQIITSVAAPATTVIGTQIVAGNAGAQTLARLPMASGVGGLNVVAARASAGCGAGTAQVFTHNTHTGALTPTVTLTPAAGGIVKHVQEVLVSPAKQQTMSIQQPGQLKAGVSATNLRQLPPGLSLTPQTASLQQVTLTPTLSLASGNTPTLSLASGNTLTVQQIQAAVKQQQQQQQAQQQAQAPTGAQQAVKQVMQQAQAQAQQRSVVGSAAHLQTSVLTSAPSSVAISGVGGAAALSGVTLGGVSAPTAQTARAQSVVSGSGLVTQLPVGSQGGAGAAGVLIQAAQGGGQAGVAGQLQQQTGDKNAAANTMRLRNPPK